MQEYPKHWGYGQIALQYLYIVNVSGILWLLFRMYYNIYILLMCVVFSDSYSDCITIFIYKSFV